MWKNKRREINEASCWEDETMLRRGKEYLKLNINRVILEASMGHLESNRRMSIEDAETSRRVLLNGSNKTK